MNHAALMRLFCEHICRAAKDSGWQLALEPEGYAWRHSSGKTLHAPFYGIYPHETLHAACSHLNYSELHLTVELPAAPSTASN